MSQEKIQLTEEEVKKFKDLFEENQKLVITAGIIYLQKMELDSKDESLKSEFMEYLSRQGSVRNELTIKYGEGSLDTNLWTYTKK